MSTVKADNFTWKTGQATGQAGTNVTGDQIVYGVAKSWVSLNGTGTIATRASFNVSSLTDNGTGQYSIYFTNLFVDANYVSQGHISGNSGVTNDVNTNIRNIAVNYLEIGSYYGTSGTGYDPTYVHATFFR